MQSLRSTLFAWVPIVLTHRIVWVGRRAQDPFLLAAADYQQRLSRYAAVDTLMIRPGSAPDEARAMQERILAGSVVVALDVHGQHHSTEELALGYQQRGAQKYTYFIGGADGFAPEVLSQADARWSLSRLTLPHRAALAIWCEQLFRVHTVLAGEAYHREGSRPSGRCRAQQAPTRRLSARR